MAATKASPSKSKKTEREVVYSTPEARIVTLTADDAREYLGWEAVQQSGVGIPELETRMGEKARLTNNNKNRPIAWGHVEELVQEFLNGRWKMNGASISIGKTKEVMAGQHRLLALVIADYEYHKGKNKEEWQKRLKSPPTMEIVLVTGVDEDDETFATLNREKPATLADTLYRSGIWPAKTPSGTKITPTVRRRLSRMLDHAVKLLWGKTGAKIDPFAPRRNPTEALDFYRNHKKVLDCVMHVYTEDDGGKDEDGKKLPDPISQYVAPGIAAGMMYLMMVSESNGESYRDVASIADRSEKKLKFTRKDDAEKFWTLFGTSAELKPIRDAITKLENDPHVEKSPANVLSVIANGWNAVIQKDKLTPGRLIPKPVDKNGKMLVIPVSVGGIDTSGMTKRDILGIEEPEPQPEEEKEETQAEKFRKKNEKKQISRVESEESANGEDVPVEDVDDDVPADEEDEKPVGYE